MKGVSHLLSLPKRVVLRMVHRDIYLGVLVGVIAGLGAIGFYYATNATTSFMMGRWAGYHPPGEFHASNGVGIDLIHSLHMPHHWFLFFLPMIGGLISGWLVFTYAPEAEGHGTDAAIEAFHRKEGNIRTRVPWLKAVASVATIGTGGSAGREGPIAQIGAGFGSFLAKRLGLPVADRRILLLAGVAGGIGATFRAPLGGAIFAVEVVYGKPEFEHEALIPCIISSITAYSLFGAVTGWGTLVITPQFHFENPTELFLYFILAVVCAGLGIVYVKVFYGLRGLFHKIPMPRVLKPALGGLILGCLAMVVPQVLGSGYGWVQAALFGKIAVWVMLVVALAKILATSLTISSGGSGGVFAPSLVVGALLGGSFGITAHQLLPALVSDPRAYVLVGMAGFFAGVANAPVASLIMVSELSGSYGLLAPLMLVCVVAMIATRQYTIYEKQVAGRMDSPAHLGDFVVDVLEGITVADLEDQGRPPILIPEDLSLRDILWRIATTEGAYYPIVNREGRMTGIFSVNDIRRILNEDIPPGLILARDIAVAQVETCRPDETLNQVLGKFAKRGLEEIPVVSGEEPEKVLFMLTRRAVLARYASELEKKRGQYVGV